MRKSIESFKVAIIIVTHNGIKWLDACLKSCDFYPVIVIDNASTDETVSYIETNYPDVILLKQSNNLGFGQANNLGIRYALDQGAEHVFLLNQDAYLVDDVLQKLRSFQKQNPQYGILSPIHITGDKKRLDKGFSEYMRYEKKGQFYSDFVLGNDLADVYEVPFINAAAWLISRDCIAVVGGFDPLFFHYGEDENYCQRIRYHGFKIGNLPAVFIVHDRQDRNTTQEKVFSSQYYTVLERSYKIQFANINKKNRLDSKIKKLQKSVFKLKLSMKFKRASNLKKELEILLKVRPLIVKSREVNALKGQHYI